MARLDRTEFLEVAHLVLLYNKHAEERFTDASQLADFMVGFAYGELGITYRYGGTMGFCIATYLDHAGETVYKPFLATHLIPGFVSENKE
jgi:hypothetical protein